MLTFFIGFLTVVLVVVSLLMVFIVLMQRPKQEGLGAAFGGGVTDQMWGAQTTNVLQKGTVYLAVLFFVITMLLAVLVNVRQKGRINTKELREGKAGTTGAASLSSGAGDPSTGAPGLDAGLPVAPDGVDIKTIDSVPGLLPGGTGSASPTPPAGDEPLTIAPPALTTPEAPDAADAVEKAGEKAANLKDAASEKAGAVIEKIKEGAEGAVEEIKPAIPIPANP